MKRLLLVATLFICAATMSAQELYWVIFTDKQHDGFNPYEYFDAKAIARYQQAGADLYDETNYPVNASYVNDVTALATEYVGESRWFNATAVVADGEQIAAIRSLPFVADVQQIHCDADLAEVSEMETPNQKIESNSFIEQVSIMQGQKFYSAGYTGKGVRIAVFDGGFDGVDTHEAFSHLFKNNQIVKTWDFVKKKENVYLGHYHGRMVLSCIAGIQGDTTLLGLAPDAQFLLARTEVKTEIRKEEVWWVQALEWADQNGADIVNSSLGYGDSRYYAKDMDGKTSYVAKGAATAADKGILVCTAMGNEGSKSEWKVLVTPADVDKVLSVGAVTDLNHRAYYSSIGPTADGRLKPNVVAKGYDLVAESSSNYGYNSGTSFATPMVTGFAACVKQMHPDYTAMQLLKEIEKSGNHYPYFDYSYGYGVPQAGYFFGEKSQTESFKLYEDEDYVYLIPTNMNIPEESDNQVYIKIDETGNEEVGPYRPWLESKVYFKIVNNDGSIERYDNQWIGKAEKGFEMAKDELVDGQVVHFWYDDTYKTYEKGKDRLPSLPELSDDTTYSFAGTEEEGPSFWDWDSEESTYNKKPKFYSASLSLRTGFDIASMWSPEKNIHQTDRISRSLFLVWGNNFKLAKVYALGLNLSFGSTWYSVDSSALRTPIEDLAAGYQLKKKNLKVTSFDLELYQRFYLSKSSRNKGIIDMGVYGMWNTGSRLKEKFLNDNTDELSWIDNHYMRNSMNKLAWGVRLRVGWEHFSIYGQYRISRIWKQMDGAPWADMPKIEVGIQLF